MTTLIQDLRVAARSFTRSPRFTLPALLALALGIGASSATYSVVRGVMLEPLPYDQPERIVVVWESNAARNRPRNVISAANFVEWKARSRSFEQLGVAGPSRLTLVIDGQPEEVQGMVASSDLFAVLGVQPAIGRGYTSDEDQEGADQVMVVSHQFWRTRLGARPDVIGQSLTANGRPRTVIGVMPPDFSVLGEPAAFFVPYGWRVEQLRSAPGRGSSFGIGRLREGVTLRQAASEMATIAAALAEEFPARNAGWSVTLVPAHEQMVEDIRPALGVLSGAVALVLLIACVNVANLLLARGTAREQELGVRAALGAGRGRLARQMLTESLLLGVLGGVAGLLLAVAFHRGLLVLVTGRIPVPRLEQVALDLPVVLFTLVVSLAAGVAFGLVPALVSARSMGDALRHGGRHGGTARARRMLGVLVVAELATALVLLAGAGLLVNSLIRLRAIDPGFRVDGLLTARVQVPGTRYGDPVRSAGFYTDALERIAAIPGVREQAAVSFLPLTGLGIGTSYYRADQPAPAPGDALSTAVRPVTPNWFRTMGIPQLAGRDFTAADRADSPPVAIVSEALARREWPGETPIGRRLHVNIARPGGVDYEVVGVVGDIRLSSLRDEAGAAVYVPHTQLAVGMMTFVLRTDLDPLSLASGVAAAVRGVDPELPLADVRTLADVVDRSLSRPRVVTTLLAVFAAMGLLLSGVGVYGVMAYAVSQRTREIGVRMALGATPGSVARLVLGQAVRLVLAGIALGLVCAAGLTQVLNVLLYRTSPLDPGTFALTAALLAAAAVLAALAPALRGTRVTPVQALRAE